MTPLDIIYINFNSTDYLIRSIQSVIKHNQSNFHFNIVVIDNASMDRPERIISKFPQIILIKNKRNFGFAKAVNQAVRYTNSQFFVLLNPDTKLVSGFTRALNFLKNNPDIGIVGPKICESDGTIQGSARKFPSFLTTIFGRKSPITKIFPDNSITKKEFYSFSYKGTKEIEVDWISGACMFVNRDAFSQVKGFDEKFFLYWEDADICKRIKKLQWRIVYYPKCTITHLVGKSSNSKPISSICHFHFSCYKYFTKHSTIFLKLLIPFAFIGLSSRCILVVILNLIFRFLNRLKKDKAKLVIRPVIRRASRMNLKKTNIQQNHKPKILHIITRLIVGGAQENTLYTAEILAKKGYFIDVLIGPQTGPEGSLIDNANKRGISIITEKNLVREINLIKDIKAFISIVKFVRRGKYSIIHTHSSKAGILGRWAAWLAKCPIIIHTVHGWGFHDFQKTWEKLMYITFERLTMIITNKLIAVSEKDINKGLSARIGKKCDYTIIRSGIDLNEFRHSKRNRDSIRKELNIPINKKAIVTVTRLSPQKSPLTFIKIAELVLRKDSNTHFVIVGDGPMRHQVEKRINELGIGNNVTLTGIRKDVSDLLHAFDIFLLTSLWEGLPRVIPQAMAAERPVVATRVDGNAEIIKHQENGILIEPNDIERMAVAVLHLLQNPEMAQKLAENAKNSIDEYDVYKMVNEIEGLYLGI